MRENERDLLECFHILKLGMNYQELRVVSVENYDELTIYPLK